LHSQPDCKNPSDKVARSTLTLERTTGARSIWISSGVCVDAGLGYIPLLNDNVRQYLMIKVDGWLLQYLPSIWRVWLLFYGTFFLARAS
jgi:hypothetical protein